VEKKKTLREQGSVGGQFSSGVYELEVVEERSPYMIVKHFVCMGVHMKALYASFIQ